MDYYVCIYKSIRGEKHISCDIFTCICRVEDYKAALHIYTNLNY